MPWVRLFTALWPDDALRAALLAQRERWTLPKGAQQVRGERLHLTLHFIGDLPHERLPVLREAFGDVRVEPIAFVLDTNEVWRNGVASLRASELPAALQRCFDHVGTALDAAGIELERRAWKPHVTLARRATGALPPAEPFAIEWRADGFVLVESVPGGRGYVVQGRYSRTSATASAPKSARSR